MEEEREDRGQSLKAFLPGLRGSRWAARAFGFPFVLLFFSNGVVTVVHAMRRGADEVINSRYPYGI